MTILSRKLLRDAKSAKWQFSALVLLVVIGMIFYVGLTSSVQNLWKSVDTPYTSLHFADFTVKVYGAPANITEEIMQTNGIASVVGRINMEVPMTMPSMQDQFLTGRIITLPRDSHPSVNDVQVVEGGYFAGTSTSEVLLEKAFADYHGLKVGDTIRVTAGTNQSDLNVQGVVVSPEYLWPARNIKDHMPTVLRNWGVLFLPEDEAKAIFNLGDKINEIAVTVSGPGVRDEVLNSVKTILTPYGLADVTVRENQASDKNVHLLVGSLDMLAPVFSGFFLAVAGVTTYVLLTRTVNSQSTQIGTMRALGYRKHQILTYYLNFAIIIWVTSAAIGIILGYVSSAYLTQLFASRINLPLVYIEPQWTNYAVGGIVSLALLLIAGALPAWQASNLNPAEAMRPRAPKLGRVLKIDKGLFFLRHASSSIKIPMRNVFRARQRALAMVLGIMLATTVVVATSSFLDSFDNLFKFMYKDMVAYDMKVTFIRPQNASIVTVSKNISGLLEAEPILEIPYHLRYSGREYSAMILGLNQNSTLLRMYTLSGIPTTVSPDGILLSQMIRDKLMIETGDSIELHLFNFTHYVTVAGFIKSSFGGTAILSLNKAQEIVGVGNSIGGLFVKVDLQQEEKVKQDLFKLPNVSSIETTAQSEQDNVEMLKLFNGFIWTIFSFGILMAFAVVFNMVSLNILERSRELATMRTIGMTMRRIAGMVTLENASLGLIGILVGLPAGNYLARYFLTFFSSDLFVLDTVTYTSTYILGAVVIFLVLLVSSVPALRYVRNIKLAKVVKEQAR